MKEYKVVSTKLGLKNRLNKLEDLLNQYAREGWTVKQIDTHSSYVIFERNKNR